MARSLLKKNSARASVGLDVDGDFIAAAQVEGGRIVAAASQELPEGTLANGEVADRDRLAETLKDFFKGNPMPRNVNLGVANQQIVVRQIQLPAIEDRKELDAAVRFQAAEAIAMPLDEAVLDYQLLPVAEQGDGQPRLNVIVVAARTAMLSELVEAARSAGLKPMGVDLHAFALVRTLAGSAGPDGPARVYCHLGGVANLAIATGSSCSFTRPLSSPWQGDAMNLAAALSHEVRLSIDYYMAQPGALSVGEMVLSGPGSRREDLVRELEATMGLPLSVAEPLGELDGGGLGPDEDPFRHTVSAGLAMGAAA
jgi:Tfp pilus assembly PilM family ATPase